MLTVHFVFFRVYRIWLKSEGAISVSLQQILFSPADVQLS